MSDVKDKLLELAKIEVAQYGEAKAKSVIGKAMGKYPEFRSQAEVVRAMSDPQYDKDPAYRQDIFKCFFCFIITIY